RNRLGDRAERELVRVLLHQRRFVEVVAERLGAESFTDERYRQIFAELIANDADAPVDALAMALDDDSTEVLQDLLTETGGLERAMEVIDDHVNAMRSRSIEARLVEIDRQLPLATEDQKDDLIRRKQHLNSEMKALGKQ